MKKGLRDTLLTITVFVALALFAIVAKKAGAILFLAFLVYITYRLGKSAVKDFNKENARKKR